MRTPPRRAQRRRSVAAKRLHLARDALAPPAPVFLLFPLRLDHARGRAARESFISQPLGQRLELRLELLELAPELPALAREIDESAERDDQLASVAEEYMSSSGGAVGLA